MFRHSAITLIAGLILAGCNMVYKPNITLTYDPAAIRAEHGNGDMLLLVTGSMDGVTQERLEENTSQALSGGILGIPINFTTDPKDGTSKRKLLHVKYSPAIAQPTASLCGATDGIQGDPARNTGVMVLCEGSRELSSAWFKFSQEAAFGDETFENVLQQTLRTVMPSQNHLRDADTCVIDPDC